MLGFSVTKLLVLAAIIALIWYGFKWVGRMNQRQADGRIARGDGGRNDKAVPGEAEDMAKCAICGTFVPIKGAADCGRDGCPYPG